MAKEIREIYDYGELDIITEKAKLPKYALAKLSYSFAKADSENDNHRTYSEDILSREINRKSEELRKGKVAGMLEHPLSGITRLDGIAHVLTDVHYDRNTKLASAESFVLDTSKGRDFMVMMDAELKMGCSMRGFGNVKDGMVQSDYKLDTVDFVLHPSFSSDATISKSNIIESANNIFAEKDYKGENMKEKMCGLSDDFVDEIMKDCHSIYLAEGTFTGSLEDFKRENGVDVLGAILIEEKKFKNSEEAYAHLEKFGEKRGVPVEPIKEIRKVTPGEVYLEAKIAGIDPKIYAEKLNKNLENSDLSPARIATILAEAQQAGIDTSDPKERKRIFDIHRQIKTRKILNEDERADVVARRTGSTPEFVKEVWAIDKKKKKEAGRISLRVAERMDSGFGSEQRPDIRKRSRRIIDGEKE